MSNINICLTFEHFIFDASQRIAQIFVNVTLTLHYFIFYFKSRVIETRNTGCLERISSFVKSKIVMRYCKFTKQGLISCNVLSTNE